MGRKKAPVNTRRKQVLKLGEQSNSSPGPIVDPYRQTITSVKPGNSFEESSSPSESENTEASTKLKNLLDEINHLGSRNSVEDEEPMNTEQTSPDDAKSDPLKVGGYSSDPEAGETAEEGVTFWKQVTDPNTNHAYYWNPRTNQVSWTLPNNGVIADDNPPQEDSNGEADNPYAGYYAYYKQHYEATQAAEKENEDSAKTEPDKATESKEETPKPKEVAQNSQSTVNVTTKPTKTQLKMAKKAKKVVTAGEQEAPVAFVGPVLPASHTLATKPQDEPVNEQIDAGRTPGLKRKASTEERAGEPVSGNGLDPAAKKPRLKTKIAASPGGAKKTSSPQTPLSIHAEQAIRFQVSNMADELTRKLDYLHVTNEGLSDIQVLNIQLQTRLSDWKEGGLNSKFMLSKLKTSAVALQEYEQLAAPEGWKIVWDSSSCRYQYHNLSTGETMWQYPLQPTESSEVETYSQEEAENSSMEESSDNEAASESPIPVQSQVPVPSVPPASKAVIGPQLPTSKVAPSNQPPAPPPREMRLTPVTTSKVAPSNQPPAPPPREMRLTPVTTSKVAPSNQPPPPPAHVPVTTSNIAPSNQPPAKPSIPEPLQPPAKPSVPEPPQYEPPKEPFVYKSYKARHREPPPPPPPPRFDLTVDQLREKLYPSLKPKRQRVRPEEPAVLMPVVPTVEMIEENPVPPPVVNREGMVFISEFPITKPEKEQSTQPDEAKPKTDKTDTVSASSALPAAATKAKTPISESSKPIVPIQISEATKARTAEIPHSLGADPSMDSEARLRERLLERQRQKGLVKLSQASDKESTQEDVSSQSIAQDIVEHATGELLISASLGGSQAGNSKQDDSRVEPETGEVEANSEYFAQRKASTSTDLYQDWTPSPTEGSPRPLGDLAQKEPSPVKPADGSIEEGELSMESESSSSSESESEGEGKDKTAPTGKCYMDTEEKRVGSRKAERRSSHRDHSDSDHERHSDDERKRRRSTRRSHKEYSSDESEERHSKKDRHRRSLRHEDRDSDDERSRKRSSRSSRRSSKKNRSRSRSGRRHRRSRSHSRDSQSPYRSEIRGKKKSPKHKKVKKEKKKKHHKTDKEQKTNKEKKEEAPKPPPNVIVGKVGMVRSKRTLGKDKKLEPDTPKAPASAAQATQQPMSATYYQHPSTGQVPYYDYYSQGYYDPNAYQQWQGQWYGTGQDSTIASQYGTVQYPISGTYTATTGSAQYTTATQSSTQYTVPNTSQETIATTGSAQDTVISSTAQSAAVVPEPAQDTTDLTQNTTTTPQDTNAISEVTQSVESAETLNDHSITAHTVSSQEAVQAPQEVINTAFKTNIEPQSVNTVNEAVQELTVQSTLTSESASKIGEEQTIEEDIRVEVSSPVKPPLPPEEESLATEEPMSVPEPGEAEMEVETEDQIEECDMDIDDNSPSNSPPLPPAQETSQPTIPSTLSTIEDMSTIATPSQEVIIQSDTQPSQDQESTQPASVSVAEDSEVIVAEPEEKQPSQEELPAAPVPPPPEDHTEAPSEEKGEPPSLAESAKTPSKAADEETKSSDSQQLEMPAESEASVPPPASTPPTPPAVVPPTTATSTYDYSAYMLAAQQQQAYNYAYATNNYMQAAYNAYVQQANAAAYQAYGSPYYPGYSTPYVAAGGFSGAYSTASSLYGSTASSVTQTSTGGGYGKVAYQLAQQAANAANTESSDTKKSEFAIAGSKSKQMKNMMDKWSSFKDGKEDSPSS